MRHVLLSLAILCSLSAPAVAQSPADLARVTVLPGWRAADGSHVAALRIDLAPGWLTYWRAPGDGGIPPAIGFEGGGILGVSPHFPVPEVYDSFGMRSFVYHDGVTLPIIVTVADPAAAIPISGQIEIGVCRDICIPVTLDFSAVLPATGAADATITAALRNRPLTAAEAGAGDVTCTVTPTGDGVQLTAQVTVPDAAAHAAIVIETGDPQIWVSAPAVTRAGNRLTATVDMVHLTGGAVSLDRSRLRFTLLGGSDAVDIQGCVAP